MRDIQATKDTRNIAIQEVGVKGITLPLFVSDKARKRQLVIAKIQMAVDLARDVKGTHMSRFVEVISQYKGYDFNNHSISQILKEMKKKLKAKSACLTISFDYFIEKKSPISKKKSLMNYRCKIIGQIIKNNKIETSLNVCVPISSVCPCSMNISNQGAHNQRGMVDLTVKTNEFVWLEDLISLIEKCGGSSEIYTLLKRKDEKHITEKMFENPKFVEDVVRDVAAALKKDRKIIDFSIECTHYESIHNHNAYAKITNKK